MKRDRVLPEKLLCFIGLPLEITSKTTRMIIGCAQSLPRFEYSQSLRKIFTKILWQNASLADSFWIRTKGDRVLPVAGKLIPFGRTGRQYPDGGHGFRPI